MEDRKASFVQILNQMIELVRPTAYYSTFELAFATLKVLGDFFMEFKDLNEAVKTYKSLKILCEDFEKYKEKLFLYEQIGYT
mmetsp:Transcript_22539/g.21702  ORF Transcript_22539/g.21702 Transcript_22539/m.21702 type:complete len:82 (+) Transcript_22539:1779-2024(+)